ncbi:MAG: alpha/beta fold hydrolase, partial [Acidobacteria bacterium]
MKRLSTRSTARQAARSLLLVLPVALLAGGCVRTLHEADFFYPRRRALVPDRVIRENVEIPAGDGTMLRGWLLRPEDPRGSLIYFYGNGETVQDVQARTFWLARHFSLRVLSVDYRGYGFSDGEPSAAALFADAVTIRDSMERRLGDGPVIAYGRSLGSFVALKLASERQLDGLILEGTVDRLENALPQLRRLAPWYVRWFVRPRLGDDLRAHEPPVSVIARVGAPLLVIQGEQDELFPPELARRLFEASPASDKQWCPVPGAGHN